jgi:type II secretory pathway pseudopilin PulG
MLVVLGILGILMSVAFSGLGAARLQAQVARANAEVRQLVSAWLSYEAAYDDWPTQVQGDDIETSESAIQELLGKNDTETVYLNVQLVNGAFRDPWGTPYRFRLLTDNSDNQSAEEFAASITFPNRHRQQAQ